MFSRLSLGMALALALGLGLAACDSDSTGSQTAHLTVALVDAPLAMFQEAKVHIGEISLIPQGAGPPVLLTEDGGEHDLLDLQNGIMADLASLTIDAGTYLQLRLQVLSAEVTLADGYEFASEPLKTRELSVPSGAETGIKVNLRYADGNENSSGVDIASGETVLLVVDMDISRNFVLQGDPDGPQGLMGVLFTPLIRATLEDVAGTISGTVTYNSATPDEETEYATITADLVPMTSPVLEVMQTLNVTTVAAEDGTYTLWFLAPGTYEVGASANIDGTDYTSATQQVPVGQGEDVEGVDLTL